METNNEILDLLVIGTVHEGVYNELIAKFPNLKSMYLHADLLSIEDTFRDCRPKRTLIYGDLTKIGSGKQNKLGELNFEILNLLLNLRESGQKILVAGYFGISHPNFVRMPVSHEKIMKKFDEMQ